MSVLFGIDYLLQSAAIEWKHSKIGLVTNEAATTHAIEPSRLVLQQAGFTIRKLFSPEHGLSAKGADGAPMHNGVDELTDLPIISLYGQKLAPDQTDMEDLDCLVFDVPDAGVRFYTYLWTLSYLLEACAKYQKPLIILDRPNPISGLADVQEGPFLEESCASFIGRWNIPLRHSCTLGELALYFNEIRGIKADLTVIPCQHWKRYMFQTDWGIPFVATSPAIQTAESLMLYPGLCLLEATNLSEGRSTDFSFEVVGAPWLQHDKLARQINQLFGEELEAKPVHFIPQDAKFAGEQCNGVHFKVIYPDTFKPVFFGLVLIRMIKDMHPDHFAWAGYKTYVNPDGIHHLDKLTGIANAEKLYELSMPAFLQQCTKITNPLGWNKAIKPYLLY